MWEDVVGIGAQLGDKEDNIFADNNDENKPFDNNKERFSNNSNTSTVVEPVLSSSLALQYSGPKI